MNLLRSIGVALLALTLGACAADGTKTGNGVHMEFAAAGQALSVSDAGAPVPFVVVDLQGSKFEIDEVVLSVSRVELRAKGENLCNFELPPTVTCTNGRLRLREQMELDLLSPGSDPQLSALEFPPVVYDRVEVRTQALDKDSALGSVSFYVSGRATINEQPNRFVLSLKRNETLRFENVDGVDLDVGQTLSAQIDVRSWFARLPLTSCVEAGGVSLAGDTWLFTEDSKCKQVEQTFVEELRRSTELSRRGRAAR